jgi:2OG-Fe(II) oxygenase superfamily
MTTWLKKEFEESGYTVESPIDGLLIVKNFLLEEDLKEYTALIEKTTEDQWYTDQLKVFTKAKFGREDVDNLVKEGLYEITSNWNDKNLSFITTPLHRRVDERFNTVLLKTKENLQLSGFYFIQRMYDGVQLVSHHDQNTDESIVHAAVAYINDDYNGGEIFWAKKDFEMKPEVGDLLIFGGDPEWEHGVRFVTEGPMRYVLPGFIKIPDFYAR